MKLSTIRIVVISETCLLIVRHKKKVMQVHLLVYYFYYILFLLSKCQLPDSFTRLLHLHKKFARDEKFAREYACGHACVCACVRRGCCNINERSKIDTGKWVVASRLWCCKIVWFESQHDKTNKVAVSDQPGHPPSLIRVFVVRFLGDSSCGQRRLWSDWADDQTALGFRWAHRRTDHFFFFFFLTRLCKVVSLSIFLLSIPGSIIIRLFFHFFQEIFILTLYSMYFVFARTFDLVSSFFFFFFFFSVTDRQLRTDLSQFLMPNDLRLANSLW